MVAESDFQHFSSALIETRNRGRSVGRTGPHRPRFAVKSSPSSRVPRRERTSSIRRSRKIPGDGGSLTRSVAAPAELGWTRFPRVNSSPTSSATPFSRTSRRANDARSLMATLGLNYKNLSRRPSTVSWPFTIFSLSPRARCPNPNSIIFGLPQITSTFLSSFMLVAHAFPTKTISVHRGGPHRTESQAHRTTPAVTELPTRQRMSHGHLNAQFPRLPWTYHLSANEVLAHLLEVGARGGGGQPLLAAAPHGNARHVGHGAERPDARRRPHRAAGRHRVERGLPFQRRRRRRRQRRLLPQLPLLHGAEVRRLRRHLGRRLGDAGKRSA